MQEKFSIGLNRNVMIPPPVQRWSRANISWGQRFFMTEAELQTISQAVIDQYEMDAQELFQQLMWFL